MNAENSFGTGLTIGMFASIVPTIIIIIVFDIDNILIMLLIALLSMIIIAFPIAYFVSTAIMNSELERMDNIGFHEGTLFLKKFNYKNGEPITVKRIYDYNLNYHPSDIRYVGVTVGGVTTGGVYDAGNYYTNDPTRTDKFWLEYKDSQNPDGTVINKIKLSGKTLDSAKKNSFIKQFLEDDTLTLMHKGKLEHESWIKSSLDQNNHDFAYRLFKTDAISMMLSKAECEKIKHWIEFGN